MNFQPNKTTESKFYDMRITQSHEASKLTGYPIYYLKPNTVKDDAIFGEVISREFLESNAHPMYIFRDDDTQFGGSELFGGFGYTPTYNAVIYIPVKWFSDLGIEPIEGDVIYLQNDEILFEITKVTDRTEAHTGDIINNTLINYKLYLKHYELSDDKFTQFADNKDLIPMDELELNSDLESLNDSLTNDITAMDIVDSTETNPFGEL